MSNNSIKVLAIDDEPAIRKLLSAGLATQDFKVVCAATAREGRLGLEADRPDIIILDIGLPDGSGLELLKEWRDAGNTTPVVILSSRADEAGIVIALDLGADDYVVKPFGMNELIARIRAALRHRLHEQGEQPIFRLDDLSVDLVRRVVKVRDEEIKLSPKEYEILRLLVQHSGKVLTHRFILHHVWDADADVQYLRVYIRQLRQKLGDALDRPKYILTETGVGYRLRQPDNASPDSRN
ncbi:MAG: two component response regulator [Hyphomicrobiales bacterium]|nr:two component response regulator [Hyphomicrobiales bacterium]